MLLSCLVYFIQQNKAASYARKANSDKCNDSKFRFIIHNDRVNPKAINTKILEAASYKNNNKEVKLNESRETKADDTKNKVCDKILVLNYKEFKLEREKSFLDPCEDKRHKVCDIKQTNRNRSKNEFNEINFIKIKTKQNFLRSPFSILKKKYKFLKKRSRTSNSKSDKGHEFEYTSFTKHKEIKEEKLYTVEMH